MVGIIRLMSDARAIGILDGTIPWTEPEEYLEASMWVVHHEARCRPLLAASLFGAAVKLSDFAADTAHKYRSDLAGEAAALQAIREAVVDPKKDAEVTKKILDS